MEEYWFTLTLTYKMGLVIWTRTNHGASLGTHQVIILPRSMTRGAFGPISIATAPAPPVLRALPAAYTAISAATTIARRPVEKKLKTGWFVRVGSKRKGRGQYI